MVEISIKINKEVVNSVIKPNTLLVDYIRFHLRKTGTHVGCDTAQCGSCTVSLNDMPVKSCNVLAVQANNSEVVTVEGLTSDPQKPHPMQEAFKKNHGLQCGFCTPGMIMNAIDIAEKHKNLTEGLIRKELDGNLCRCTGYQNIINSILEGASKMKINVKKDKYNV